MKESKRPSIGEFIWLFVFGCLLGFVLETIYYYLKNGIWINKQGLLYGPFKPMYGFGLVLIVLLMHGFKDKKKWQKFLIGVFIGSAFEYLGSVFQEYIFGTSTWDYSSFSMNLSGRLYLPYCLAWGVIAVLCIDYLYPLFKKLFLKVPRTVGKYLTTFVAIFMIANVVLTSLATIRYSDRANNIEASNKVFKIIDEIYNDNYMQIKFPKLNVIKK